MTAEQRTRATLAAHSKGMRTTEGAGFVIPLKHVEEHFVRWCFMVRHPWSAEPVRGVWFDSLRSRLFVEKYSFKPQKVTYGDADDRAILGTSDTTLALGYCFASCWGPTAYCGIAFPGASRNGWFQPRLPMVSYQGNLYSSSDVATAPASTANRMRCCSPATSADYSSTFCLFPASITGDVGGNSGRVFGSWGTGPLLRGANWGQGTGEGTSYRCLAAGQKIWFLSSAQNRKGSITFLETSNHKSLDYEPSGSYGAPYVADVVSMASTPGYGKYTGVRRYALAGNTEGFHQVWHPMTLSDHQWLANGPGAPYTSVNQTTSENLDYPGALTDYTYGNSNPSHGYSNPCLWIASGVASDEDVVCEYTIVYEMVDEFNDGEDYSIMIDCAPRAAAKMCEQYSDAVVHHEGTSGAELRSTSEVATAELL